MSKINTAVILAAGRGSRLKELSLEQPKPMTEVNNLGILNNLIRHIIDSGIPKIVVVTGYFAQKLEGDILAHFDGQAEFIFIENEIFDKTNNIYSLWLANAYLSNGFYLFEADVFCDYDVVAKMVQHPVDNLMILGRYTDQMNGTVVDLDGSKNVLNMYLPRHQQNGFDFSDMYKTINFYKLSAAFVKNFFLSKLEEHIKREDVNSYYELIIQEAIERKFTFYGLDVEEARWWEIDTIEDLSLAEKLFNQEKSSI